MNELTLINETLQKEIIYKDREIQRLNKDVQQYEQTIMNLRADLSFNKYHTPDISKKDAEVMADICCTGTECRDWEPVKDITALVREETLKYKERLQKMEEDLKNSSKSVHALRKANIILGEETQAMRRMCLALDEQSRTATVRAQFKDEIIREIRRQLKHAKAKVRESAEFNSYEWSKDMGSEGAEGGAAACVRVQPRRAARTSAPQWGEAGEARECDAPPAPRSESPPTPD